MKKLNIHIEPGEPPPSLAAIESLRRELNKLSKTVSGVSTSCLGLVLASFIAAQVEGEFRAWAIGALVTSAMGYLLSYRYELGPLARCIASVQPVPDVLSSDTRILARHSETTRAYEKAVRDQNREFILAEHEALVQHALRESANSSRITFSK